MDRFYADLSNSSIWILSAGYSHHKTNEDKRVFRDQNFSRLITVNSEQILLRHILLREQMLEIRNFAENETERKFLLKQLVTRSAVLPFGLKSNMPVLPAAHLSKASENLTSLNKNGTRFKGWSKLLQD